MTITDGRRGARQRIYAGQQAGLALVAWLNDRSEDGSWLSASRESSRKAVERSLTDAVMVCQEYAKFGTEREFHQAAKGGRISAAFWDARDRWNRTMADFTHVPTMEPSNVYEGKRIVWSLAEHSPIGLIGMQLDWIIELIQEDALLKVRKCQQCANWYFARFERQEFCSNLCRGKNHSRSDAFRQRRRKYMREYYRSRNSGKTKRGSVSQETEKSLANNAGEMASVSH
jgi:hypothetical protein